MKAARLSEFHGKLEITEVPIPEPKEGEVLAKVLASGLCASDLHIIDGMISTVTLPYTPGHELCGEICEIGPGVKSLRKGDRFVAAIDLLCGECRFCVEGRENLCVHRTRIGFERNGSHQQYCVVPSANVFPVSKKIPCEQAAVIPDAVACMYHAMTAQGKVHQGDVVCIMGVGGLGLQGIQIAKHLGATVVSTSRQDKKLAIAAELGSDYTVNTKTQNLREEILRLTAGLGCDVVFDNIGISGSVREGMSVLRRGGKIIVVGYSDPNFDVDYQDLVLYEKEIIGIRGSTPKDLRETIDLVENGVLKPFIYKTYGLSAINEALQRLRDNASLGRTVILPWEE
ncbi:succinate-semialdehyde dehydrogenase [Synergistales bacterium]|nr:succinate-semialdehyde dehydrogenase [Synergistales bacterium]